MAEEFKANPNLVNKELADRSHAHTSFSPEKRAEQEIQGFADHVQNVYDELKKYAKTETQKAFLITEMQRYQSGYAEKYNTDLAAKGRTFSSMITGGSNFPTRRHEKANRAEQNRYEEMKVWDDRAQAAILRELKKMAVEEAGGEVEVLKAKIAQAEELQERMKKANAIVRKNIAQIEKIGHLTNLGFDATQVQGILKPDFMGRVGFPAFELQNNNARIRSMKERIGELEKKEATPSGDIPFEGGTMHDSKEDDRVQLFFDQKPPQDMIDKLKGEGWRWSPSIGAWQRKRTDNALFSARRILGLEQQNPIFVPVKEEPKVKESLIDALLNIQPGKSILIEYGDIPKDAERITLPNGIAGTVIERRGNLLAIGMLAGAAVTTALYVQKDSQMIQIRPIPHQKMLAKTGETINTPQYDRWVERMKKEAPDYLPEWEKGVVERKIPDAEFEKAKLFLSSLAMARTLDELTGWQPAVKRWSIKFPELEKELESEYQARYEYLKAAKETAEGTSRIPIERLYVTKLVEKPAPRYQPPVKKEYVFTRDHQGNIIIEDSINPANYSFKIPALISQYATKLLSKQEEKDWIEFRRVLITDPNRFEGITIDNVIQDKQAQKPITKSEEETAIKESFPTLKEAKKRKSELEYTGYLIKEDIEEDHSIFGKPKFTIAYIPEDKPAYKGFKKIDEKGKVIIENPFGVDLSKSIVPYPTQKKPELTPDTSSKDYKAGYNLAIQGRIAPAVPAWTDQGKADFAQGYKDGQKEVPEPTGYFSLKKAQDLVRENNLKLSDELLHEKTIKLRDYMGFIEHPDEYSRKTLVKGGYYAGVADVYATGMAPVDAFLYQNMRTTLEEVYKEQDRRKKEKEKIPVFGLPQDTKKFVEEFGKPVQAIPEKPRVIGAPSRQEQTEREQRAKAQEGKKLKGQVTLFGAVSTSRRLGEFEEKPIIPQQPVKSMAEVQAEKDKEEERKANELANHTIAEITINKLKKQISFEQQRLF